MSEMSVASINERASEEYYKRGIEAEKEGNHEKSLEFYERALNDRMDRMGDYLKGLQQQGERQ